MTSIEGGTIPFYVEAPGASVTIQALRFVRPTREAILVYAAGGLTVVSCKIVGVVPVNHNSDGIGIKTTNLRPPQQARESPRLPEVIRAVNIGSYVIAHNLIDCGWADAEAIGIGVFAQVADWPIERAMVVDNDVTMSAPQGTLFGDFSAGIDIRGFAQGNVVLNNRIRGRARAALSVDVFNGGIPDSNAFVLNHFDDFEGSLADVFVGAGVTNTRIVGQGTVENHGVGTVITEISEAVDGKGPSDGSRNPR